MFGDISNARYSTNILRSVGELRYLNLLHISDKKVLFELNYEPTVLNNWSIYYDFEGLVTRKNWAYFWRRNTVARLASFHVCLCQIDDTLFHDGFVLFMSSCESDHRQPDFFFEANWKATSTRVSTKPLNIHITVYSHTKPPNNF